MDVPNVLNSLIILMILTRCIGPSREIAGANDLIEVFHHPVGEFGGEEGDGSPIIECIPCFISQGFKFSNESIDFPWCESEMTEFLLCALRGTSVLECCFEGSGDSSPVVFIVGVQPCVVLVKGPYGPPLLRNDA